MRFSLDDFGTGCSSLVQLKRFSIDSLKLERVFVNDVVTNRNDAMLVRDIISLAPNIEICAVAEGIETSEQPKFRVNSGADFG